MDWIKVPLWGNAFAVQQDSLVVSDTLSHPDSIYFDTIPVLSRPDSISAELTDSSGIRLGDTNKLSPLTGIEDVDTLGISRQIAPAPSRIITQTIIKSVPEISSENPVFDYNYIPFQADHGLFRPGLFFPENILLLKDISKKSKQLDFFIYDESHKNESGSTTTAKLKNPTDILNQNLSSNTSPGWLLGVFLILFILLARMKFFFEKFIPPIINSSFNFRIVQNLYRNRNSLYYQAGINLDFIFFLSAGIFIFQLLKYFELNPGSLSGFPVFLIAIVFLFAWLVLKFFVCKLIGFFSLNTALFNEYFHSILIYNKNIGLFLIPITLGIAYINPSLNKMFIFIGLGIVSIAYILQAIRLIRLFNSKRISSFYSILYLCALEILPVLLLVRVFIPINKV